MVDRVAGGPWPQRPLNVLGPRGTSTMLSCLQQAYDVRYADPSAKRQGLALTACHSCPGHRRRSGLRRRPGVRDHCVRSGSSADRECVGLPGGLRPGARSCYPATHVFPRTSSTTLRGWTYWSMRCSFRNFERDGVPPSVAKSDRRLSPHARAGRRSVSRDRPGLAVYSHVCLPTATDQELLPATRKTYAGPLEIGEDLMVIEVGESVEVRRPPGSLP